MNYVNWFVALCFFFLGYLINWLLRVILLILGFWSKLYEYYVYSMVTYWNIKCGYIIYTCLYPLRISSISAHWILQLWLICIKEDASVMMIKVDANIVYLQLGLFDLLEISSCLVMGKEFLILFNIGSRLWEFRIVLFNSRVSMEVVRLLHFFMVVYWNINCNSSVYIHQKLVLSMYIGFTVLLFQDKRVWKSYFISIRFIRFS